jgi:hypothetical protein
MFVMSTATVRDTGVDVGRDVVGDLRAQQALDAGLGGEMQQRPRAADELRLDPAQEQPHRAVPFVGATAPADSVLLVPAGHEMPVAMSADRALDAVAAVDDLTQKPVRARPRAARGESLDCAVPAPVEQRDQPTVGPGPPGLVDRGTGRRGSNQVRARAGHGGGL